MNGDEQPEFRTNRPQRLLAQLLLIAVLNPPAVLADTAQSPPTTAARSSQAKAAPKLPSLSPANASTSKPPSAGAATPMNNSSRAKTLSPAATTSPVRTGLTTGKPSLSAPTGAKSMLRALSENEPIGDKWAVVIGISKFADPQVPSLRYSAKDAKDFYDYLVDPRLGKFKPDHVKLLTDEKANTVNIRDTLGDSFLPHAANPNDLVVIYLSTHGSPAGMDIGHVNYIVAHDTEVKRLFATGIEMRDLVKKLKERIHTRRILMVLDTCYSGAGQDSHRANADSPSVAQGIGSMVICSSTPNQRSWESDALKNSYFTRYLIDALKSNPDAITIEDAFQSMKQRVQGAVQKEKGESQTPVLSGGFAGPKLVLGAPSALVRPAPITAPLEESAPVNGELASYGIHMRTARQELDRAKFWESRHELDEAIKANPKSVDAQLLLADLLDIQRNYDEAFRAAQTAVAYDLESSQARHKLARAYWRLGQNDEALRQAEKAVSLDPDDSMSHYWLGKLNDDCLSRHDFAEHEFRKALELNNLNGRAYLALGILFSTYGGKDPKVAEAFAKRALDCDDHDVEASLVLSRFMLKRGESFKAEALLKKAIMVDPTNPILHTELGNALALRADRKVEAENELRKGVELGKNLGVCHLALARFLYAAGLIDDSEKEFRAAVKLDSKQEEALVGLANLLLKDKKTYEGVELLYRNALAINPRHTIAMLGIGRLKLEQYKDYPGAETVLRQVISLDPKLSDAHVLLGQSLFNMNRALEAREEFEKGVNLNPANGDAQFQLGLLFLSTDKNTEKALQHIKKAAELMPNNAIFQIKLGHLEEQLNANYDVAAACYRKAMEIDSVNADAHLRLALLLIEKLKQRKIGEDELRKSYQLNHENPETITARARYLKD